MKILISEFSRIYFDFLRNFYGFNSFKKGKKGEIYRAGRAELAWRTADTWQGHVRPHGH